MGKYICIHGHFYQPPRENAWLEVIEQQESAYPFHNWNERITLECYAANAASRILDEDKRIINIISNYAHISFNFGATLLDWMEKNSKEAYKAILRADILSQELFNGHGSAIAQVYNHIIMPLANKRDKITQIKWGLNDFERRFNRKSEGMWLAETAVDTETLEILADHNIKFTILAPRQAKKIKLSDKNGWIDVNPHTLDTKTPYLCKLPSGKTIILFFYNGDLSQEVAFKGILNNGKQFAEKLLGGFDYLEYDNDQLVHIATDGESYGHHHKNGEMALAYCINYIRENDLARITNYSEYLTLVTVSAEVEIHENSSWSCVHGVERWRADCGCNSGMKPGYTQKWRAPLRQSLNWLRDQLAITFEKELSPFYKDVWKLRNEYIDVIVNRSNKNVLNFIDKHIKQELTEEQKTKVIRLLEMERQSLLMFTSCGWFFDEISGIETIQILQYANRAIQLAERESDVELEEDFLDILIEAPSNKENYQNGKNVYNQKVSPSRLTLSNVAAHYAVASLFAEYPKTMDICNYRGKSNVFYRIEAGQQILALGITEVDSKVTHSIKEFSFVVLYLGQHQIIGSMSSSMTDEEFEIMRIEITASFEQGKISEVISQLQKHFESQRFSIWSLFRDERIKVLKQIVETNLEEAENVYKSIYNNNYNLMNSLRSTDLPVPHILKKNLEIVVNNEIVKFFKSNRLHPSKLESLIDQVKGWGIPLDETEIAFSAKIKLLELFKELKDYPDDIKLLTTLQRVLYSLSEINITLDLWQIQNEYFRIGKHHLSNGNKLSDVVTKNKKLWKEEFDKIGDLINVEIAWD